MAEKEKKKNKRVGSTIFRIVLIIIAGLTVGIGVFTWNATGLVGNQLPMPFGFGVSVVMSPSMEPVLHTNDLVFVTEQDSYNVDDIIVYQEGKMLVIHRIVSIDGDKVITKGDANNIADDPILLSDIKAKLSFRIPFIGVIFKYLKTVPGTLLVLFVAIFLLYRSRQKERDKDREELEDIVEEIKRLRSAQNAADSSAASMKESEAPEDGTDAAKETEGKSSEAGNENADAENTEFSETAEAEKSAADSEASSDDAGAEKQDPTAPSDDAGAEKQDPSESSDDADAEEQDPSEPADDAEAEEQGSSEPADDADTEVNNVPDSANEAETELDETAVTAKEAETVDEESSDSTD